jgi:hypothetical protein
MRNEYQEYFPGNKGCRCVGLTTVPPSCTDFLGASTSWNHQALSRPAQELPYLYMSNLLGFCKFM